MHLNSCFRAKISNCGTHSRKHHKTYKLSLPRVCHVSAPCFECLSLPEPRRSLPVNQVALHPLVSTSFSLLFARSKAFRGQQTGWVIRSVYLKRQKDSGFILHIETRRRCNDFILTVPISCSTFLLFRCPHLNRLFWLRRKPFRLRFV